MRLGVSPKPSLNTTARRCAIQRCASGVLSGESLPWVVGGCLTIIVVYFLKINPKL